MGTQLDNVVRPRDFKVRNHIDLNLFSTIIREESLIPGGGGGGGAEGRGCGYIFMW